jgi:hypothetical protein
MYVMPGSPSPGGRKPGIRHTGQLVTRKGPEGSNPSPGAHLEEISVCFKTYEWETKAKAVNAGTKRRRLRHMNEVAFFNDATRVVTSPIQEKQARTEEEQDRGSLDRLVDSITEIFQGKSLILD